MGALADVTVILGIALSAGGVAWLMYAQYVRRINATSHLLRGVGVSLVGGALVLIGSALG
ncbi:MAG: hypothetical protein ACOC5M_00905 [Chloroflexota bacterium]